jgi:hypothetical protein
MVRNTEGLNELIERTRDIPMSPEPQHREPQRDSRGGRARGC